MMMISSVWLSMRGCYCCQRPLAVPKRTNDVPEVGSGPKLIGLANRVSTTGGLPYTVGRAIVASQRVSTSQACRPYFAAARAAVVAHMPRFWHLDVGGVRGGVAAMARHLTIARTRLGRCPGLTRDRPPNYSHGLNRPLAAVPE